MARNNIQIRSAITKGRKNPALNAVKHGGYAKTKVLFCESQREYDRHARAYQRSFCPQDAIELELVNQLTHLSWVNRRLMIGLEWQEKLLLEGINPKECAIYLGLTKLQQDFIPDYFINIEHSFTAKEVEDAKNILKQSVSFIKLLPTLSDTQLMEGAHHEFLTILSKWLQQHALSDWRCDHKPNHLSKLWTDRQPLLIQEINKMCASIFYRAHWPELKPLIRCWLESQYFVLKYDSDNSGDVIKQHKEIDKRQEALYKQRQLYAHHLMTLIKYRKSMATFMTSL